MPMNNKKMRPRVSGFNPKALPGFVYWLDASQSSTITAATGVSEWRDAAGGAIKATQITANSQPAYQAAQQNGKNAVYFDGTNDRMVVGDISASFPSAASAIFAYRPSNDTEYTLYNTANNLNFQAYPTASSYMGTFKTTRFNNVASPFMPTNANAILAIVSSAAAYRVYIDDVLRHDVAADFSAGINHNFAVNDLGTFMTGWLYEAIFTSSALSAANLSAAHKYLKAKWGI